MPLADLQIGKAKPGWKPVRTKKRKVPVPNSRKFESTGKKNKLAEEKGLYLEVDLAGGKY